MIAWAVALVVWIAAGARIGRVLAREPTPLRNAMVVAVVSAAVASTVMIPDVWAVVDDLSPGSDLARTITLLAWLLFSAGSAMGAIAVWPVVPRRWMRPLDIGILGVTVVIGVAACLDVRVAALVFMAIALALVIGTGLVHVAWAPLGRGIALIVAGTSILFVTVVVALVGELSGDSNRSVNVYGIYAAAALLVPLGSVWVLAEMWVRARRDLRRIRALHKTLVERFPEVVEGVGGAGTTVLRASDSIAQIMDAMYVQSGAGMFETAGPPQSVREHSRIVADWVREPEKSEVIDTQWIAPPNGMSSRRWVIGIADEFNRTDRGVTAPVG